jgi:hypothetical protein
LPLDGTVSVVSGQTGGFNLFELMQSLEFLAALVEHLRVSAMDAVLPQSERRGLKDTLAFRDFVSSLLSEGDTVGTERLAGAIVHLSDDAKESSAPSRPARSAPTQPTARRVRKPKA